VDLHLGPGTYYLGIYLYRYDVQQNYDQLFPATSFVVATDRDVLGPSNLYPSVTGFAVLPQGPVRLEAAATATESSARA
jgi:hypothetical protein